MFGHWLAAGVGLGVTLLTTPLVRRLALHYGWVDQPNERKVHTVPTPRLGGLAIYLGLLSGVLVAHWSGTSYRLTRPYGGILLGASLLVAVGIADDLYDLWPSLKLLGQTLAALVALSFGVTIQGLALPWRPAGQEWTPLGAWGPLVTVVWMVALINAVNWLDGLDGLAAGVAFISAATLTTIGLSSAKPDPAAALFTIVLAGTALGFLPYNFHPAKIFMGDTGAMLLGFLLAAVSVTGVMKSATLVAIGVPVLALGVPIFDTVQAILGRLQRGQPIYRPDRSHVHHRLLSAGWSHRGAVLVIWAVSGLFCSAALSLMGLEVASATISVLVGLLLLLLCIRRPTSKG